MVLLGIDAHERNHTVVADDERGRKLGERTTGATTEDHAARAYLERRRGGGDTKAESLRALKRRLPDVVYRALLADAALLAGTERLAA